MNWPDIAAVAATLFFVMDPIGNMPAFNALLSRFETGRRARITARELVIALGILLVCGLIARLGWARVGTDFGWRQLLGAGFLAGIGFTMSLFVGELAFEDQALRQQAKLGILLASLLAGVLGFLILRAAPSPRS